MKANPNQNQSSTASLRPETAVARIAAFRHRGLLLVALALLASCRCCPCCKVSIGTIRICDAQFPDSPAFVGNIVDCSAELQNGPIPNGQYTPLAELTLMIEHR